MVSNNLDIDRTYETVEIRREALQIDDLNLVGVRDAQTGIIQISQVMDQDDDGIQDVLLFQPDLGPKSKKVFEVIKISNVAGNSGI